MSESLLVPDVLDVAPRESAAPLGKITVLEALSDEAAPVDMSMSGRTSRQGNADYDDD